MWLSHARRTAHAKLSTRLGAGRLLVLHGQSAGPPQQHLDAENRCAPGSRAVDLATLPLRTDAFVVLPDHIHAVWTLPLDDTEFAVRWRMIKSRFARSIPKEAPVSRSRKARGERGIWQRRFWEHLIRNEQDYSRHIEYCYINPVKHALVRRVQNWPYSSFHRDVRAGIFPFDWAGEIEVVGEFGERV